MRRTVTSSTGIILGAALEKSFASAAQMYRLRKSFAAVHFEPAGKGRIVFLPPKAAVRIIGPSRLCECVEVMFENQLYNLFKVDVLGPWSTSIKPKPVKPNPIALSRDLGREACA